MLHCLVDMCQNISDQLNISTTRSLSWPNGGSMLIQNGKLLPDQLSHPTRQQSSYCWDSPNVIIYSSPPSFFLSIVMTSKVILALSDTINYHHHLYFLTYFWHLFYSVILNYTTWTIHVLLTSHWHANSPNSMHL